MSEKETISLREEVQALNLYLELEKMRFTDQFQFHISVNNNIDKDAIELSPMLIQPYAENAIKHGLLHREGLKKLKIVFEIKNQFLQVIIDDNGIGRTRSDELHKIKTEKTPIFCNTSESKKIRDFKRRLK